MTVEEALRYVEDRAAMMRFLVERAAESLATTDRQVLTGLGDIFDDIETLTRQTRRTIPVDALNGDVQRD
jgi:hypothetical protein